MFANLMRAAKIMTSVVGGNSSLRHARFGSAGPNEKKKPQVGSTFTQDISGSARTWEGMFVGHQSGRERSILLATVAPFDAGNAKSDSNLPPWEAR